MDHTHNFFINKKENRIVGGHIIQRVHSCLYPCEHYVLPEYFTACSPINFSHPEKLDQKYCNVFRDVSSMILEMPLLCIDIANIITLYAMPNTIIETVDFIMADNDEFTQYYQSYELHWNHEN